MRSEWNTLWNLGRLRRSQWLKGEHLEVLQMKKLRAILDHVYDNVEFYHRRFDSLGIKPSDIGCIDDLRKIPPTTRSDVVSNFPSGIVSKGIDLSKCDERHTSGSTDTPVKVIFDSRDQAFRIAVFFRAMMECGYRVTDKLTTVSYRDEKMAQWFQRLGLLRRQNIQSMAPVDQVVQMLREYKPDVLYSYASYLVNVTKKLRDEGKGDVEPRIIFSHAELLDKMTRDLVRDAFGREVLDTYGSVEFMRLAWECPERSGYHIDADGYILEFVRDDENVSSGERGEILVTNLDAYAMPLIRYEIGDCGVPVDDLCPCGRGLPMMKCLEGRRDDFIVLPDGNLVSPRRASTSVWRVLGVDKYRIIQRRKDLVVLELVGGQGFSENTLAQASDGLRQVLGSDVRVAVEIVDDIPTEKSGKMRKVISEVSR